MPNISYISEGSGDIILFLHGWGQNKEMMYPLIDELKNKYRCIVVDLPGFGDSKFNGSENISEYIGILRKFLQDNDLLPKYIVAHSFGGKVAVEYYLNYRDIDRVVIIASPLLKPKRTIKYCFKILLHKIKKKMGIRNSNGGSQDYKNCSSEMKHFFVNVVNTHYNKQLKNVDIPFLLLWGNKDKQVPLNRAKKLNEVLKHSQLYVENGGHFAYLENIEFTRLAIQSFLRRA